MKTTEEPLFSNGTEFMEWQDMNCCQCAKAVWYNERTDSYPQYKCMLQRDIEYQLVGGEINVRTYNLIYESVRCPKFVDKNAPVKPRKKKPSNHDGQPTLSFFDYDH